jgi:transcription termination factor NusB
MTTKAQLKDAQALNSILNAQLDSLKEQLAAVTSVVTVLEQKAHDLGIINDTLRSVADAKLNALSRAILDMGWTPPGRTETPDPVVAHV